MMNKDYYMKVFIWLCMVIVPLLVGFYAISLGQDTNWDLLNYHLYNPYSYLHGRINLDLAPAGLQTYFNPFLDIMLFSAVHALTPKLFGFLIGVIQGLNFILVYKICRRVLGKSQEGYSLFLGVAGILSVGFISEIGTTLNDSLTALFPLVSLWLVFLSIDKFDRNSQHAFVLIGLSGILMGIGCGLKLVISIYALGLLLTLLFVPIAWGSRLKLALVFGAFSLAGLLLSGGYWFYVMWNEFGNPLFPQFNNIFHGELAHFEPSRDIRFLPKNLYEKIFYPFLFTSNPLRVAELQYWQVSWVFGYVSLIGLVIIGFTRSIKGRDKKQLSPQVIILVAFFCISYVLWLNIFGIYRYLIPIEILMPLLIFVAFKCFFRQSAARWSGVILISLITFPNLKGAPDWGHSSWSESLYRVEPSALSNSPEPSVVYLVGQPLAWIVPALEINAAFIQLAPNILVSDVYWQRAKRISENRPGKRYVVFESTAPTWLARANKELYRLGLELDKGDCDNLVGYLGMKRHEYQFCGVKFLEIK
ncbi:MAG: hypothetical protein HOM15_09090 [Gammaproteobacteria bacterium]|jgi:hypothetical protein|nr:hypothetical protein [Gammaproteobacteria bacterium]